MASLPREVALLPTPSARDCKGESDAPSRHFGSGIQLPNAVLDPSGWDKYIPAIEHWEALSRPAPSPDEPGRNGKRRLNPEFSEWMMGLPGGYVTDIPGLTRIDQFGIIGNGCMPQQAALALRLLVE
jgi:hypothetical protein